MLKEYNNYKNKLEDYDNVVESAKERSKILWYEAGEKSSTVF